MSEEQRPEVTFMKFREDNKWGVRVTGSSAEYVSVGDVFLTKVTRKDGSQTDSCVKAVWKGENKYGDGDVVVCKIVPKSELEDSGSNVESPPPPEEKKSPPPKRVREAVKIEELPAETKPTDKPAEVCVECGLADCQKDESGNCSDPIPF